MLVQLVLALSEAFEGGEGLVRFLIVCGIVLLGVPMHALTLRWNGGCRRDS